MTSRDGSDAKRPVVRRPAFLDASTMEALGGSVDPMRDIESAHESAALLVSSGRAGQDPELTARLVDLVEEMGLSSLAELWAQRPARSLPGALWRLYALREWAHRHPLEASAEYAAGMRHAHVSHVVAGAAEPPGPSELKSLADSILAGVFEGDLAVALERAAAFCRLASAGRAELSDGEQSAHQAAALLSTAGDLDACAALWRRGELH